MNFKIIIDIIGWTGAVLLLLAYFLVSTKKRKGDSVLYQTLNIIGSAFLVANAGYYHAFPSVFVNIVWICIGAFTILIVLKNQMSKKKI